MKRRTACVERVRTQDRLRGKLEGRVLVTDKETGNILLRGRNQITDYGHEEFLRALLARDVESLVWYIVVGKGGDCDSLSPHPDTGARVPPDPSEEEIRVMVEAVPIETVARGVLGEITYKALARRQQGNSPDINEFALYTRGNKMVAHFVTEEDVIPPRARKYVKSELSYWVIEWTLTYTGA